MSEHVAQQHAWTADSKPSKRSALGLVLFWVGTAYVVAASWAAMWWLAPVWRNTPAREFEGTIWAWEGPVFMTIALSVPLGLFFAAVGMLVHARSAEHGRGPTVAFVAGGLLVGASMLFPPTLGYHPTFFGVAGGLIYLFFFSALWYWGKNRRDLTGKARAAADCQLASYVFFLLTASLACTLLGNPYSGLYFPQRVLAEQSLPYHYAMGTKMAIYFVLGWLFSLLAQRLNHQHHRGCTSMDRRTTAAQEVDDDH